MMPGWHQLVSMSGHVEESETARKLQLYATSIYQVHSFVCQLDYIYEILYREIILNLLITIDTRICNALVTKIKKININ